MIPAAVERSIVEIVADATTSLGTGFLVSADGIILTAKHVVDVRTTIEARFSDHPPAPATLIDSGDGAGDWVLFRLTQPVPPGIAPMPLGRIGNVASEVRWSSVGHAKIRGGQRGAFHGVVRRVDPQLELFCEELEGQTHDDARGLSGGPCLVDGEAIGLIVDVLRRNNGAIVTGQVNAIPLEQIVPTKVSLALAGGPELPWEDVFTGPLERLAPADRVIAAAEASLPNPAEGPRLARQIARRMINQGVVVTAKVLQQLGQQLGEGQVDQIMSLAETLWISGSAAESLAVIVEAGATAQLTTERDWSARHHLKRAFACRHRGAVPWRHVVVAADHTAESFADAIVDGVFATLSIELKARNWATVKQRVAAGSGVTAFVVSPPRKDVVAKLRAELPRLAIVFMSRALPSASTLTAVDPVTPAPTDAAEQQAETLNEYARSSLP